jgi:hypothetical protein
MAVKAQPGRVRHGRREKGDHFGHLDLGFGMALWVSEMIQDEKQHFTRRMRFSGVRSPANRTRAREGQAG